METDRQFSHRVAVIIPCYRVGNNIYSVLSRIGPEVHCIYLVDDRCPDNTGSLVEKYNQDCNGDRRIHVLYHKTNKGVGGAVITGYQQALTDGATILIKLDGDGQMNPQFIPHLIAPIIAGEADYTKGNRFYYPEHLQEMPALRIFGNAGLSFLTKLSSGYWELFDPTNGYTAIHHLALELIPLHKLSQRFFFESDLLFRLNTIQAVVMDIPMASRYGDEESNLKILSVLWPFFWGNCYNFTKRIFYNYYLRSFSIASLELLLAIPLLLFGFGFGSVAWLNSFLTGEPATAGTVMLAALPIILGVQLILSFINYDIAIAPRIPIHRKLMPGSQNPPDS
ncbi:glycosyltransferase family 2 protein [Roseofilum casamattae]|uniref:Glycosyltransferase family 2 protein n=1 Tax=Roseofilum casamattae BLCC-M143 TaxID=3022442 RepID=A0ABT7BR63_9CYAN|nr:glycosyltransferase family 2 protein [Roseofilum casamattae]MDJ1181679.1 glycosyltransferase family 2 protein [Roseofilum casamattae BLCC-M143]